MYARFPSNVSEGPRFQLIWINTAKRDEPLWLVLRLGFVFTAFWWIVSAFLSGVTGICSCWLSLPLVWRLIFPLHPGASLIDCLSLSIWVFNERSVILRTFLFSPQKLESLMSCASAACWDIACDHCGFRGPPQGPSEQPSWSIYSSVLFLIHHFVHWQISITNLIMKMVLMQCLSLSLTVSNNIKMFLAAGQAK